MNGKALNEHDERAEGFLIKEKQDRREFLRNVGKAALPAIAFLGLGAIGSRKIDNTRPGVSKDCETECSSGCGGVCLSGCSGGSQGKVSGAKSI